METPIAQGLYIHSLCPADLDLGVCLMSSGELEGNPSKEL